MGSARPSGCLGWLAALLGVKPENGLPDGPLPYRLRDDFLSAAELAFVHALEQAVGERAVILAKVNLGDLFYVPRGKDEHSYRLRISQKHCDFVLCEPRSMRPIAGIELDDASHHSERVQKRDALVERVFQSAGLPLLRCPVRGRHEATELADRLATVLERKDGERTPRVVPPDASAPVCPKCDVPLVRRTAGTGPRQGQTFWGCPNYPRCRVKVTGNQT